MISCHYLYSVYRMLSKGKIAENNDIKFMSTYAENILFLESQYPLEQEGL